MFGIGPQEVGIVLLVIVVLFWAPSQLPKLGRNIGQGIKEFRNIGKEIRRSADDVTEAVKDGVKP